MHEDRGMLLALIITFPAVVMSPACPSPAPPTGRQPRGLPVKSPHPYLRAAVCALALCLAVLLCPLPALADGPALFGTVEFRRPLDSLPAWAEVRRMNELEPIFREGKVFTRTATWDTFRQGAKGKQGMELLRYVNSFWNRFPYREDMANWGKADYWVWPNLFLKKSGDCEDYAITKYFTLKELGMETDKLRIVVLRDTLRRLSHAVLAVYLDNDIVILDNISNAILPQGRLRHYVPQFSFNENARWAHMKGKKTNE